MLTKVIYHCLTSDGKQLNLEADEHLFIDELMKLAERDDLMIQEVEDIEE